MNRLVISLLLAAFSGSAAAEWVRLDSTDNYIVYADPTTIRRSGTMVKMWLLFDFKTADKDASNGKPYLSSKDQSEYDCKEERSRTLYFSNHSGQMGDGEVVYISLGNNEWWPVAPKSIRESLWKFACGKK